jgi:hypothetical protein
MKHFHDIGGSNPLMKRYLASLCLLLTIVVRSNAVPDVAGHLPVTATYTIGGTDPDFATITEAVAFLNGGIAQPVTFLIRPGTYTEQISIGSIAGASANNTIMFRSENGDPASVIVTHATTTLENGFVWRLQSCSFFTIRDITIKPTGTQYAAGMILEGTMEKLRIINNIFDTPEAPPFYTEGYGYGIWSYADAYLYASRISDNKFYNGHYGFIFYGSTIAVNFPSVPADSVLNNQFIDQRSDAIHGYYGNSYLFANNTIVSKHNSSRAFFVIDTNNSTFRENNIRVKGDGIRLGSLNNCQLINNFVNVEDVPGSTNDQIGISITGSENKLFYNTVVMREDSPDALAVSMSIGGTLPTEIKNNIFYNMGEGVAVNIQSLYASTSSFISDHNDIYTPMTKLLTWSSLYFGQDHDAYLLSDWTTFSGQDSHSISINPELVSGTDLHAQSPALIGAGTPLTIITDIDGATRHATLPTIGADEFGTVRYHDAAIVSIDEFGVCEAPRGFALVLQNNAVEKITSLQIDWSVNGVSQPPIQWTGEIPRNYQEGISFPELSAATTGTVTLSATISSINQTSDENPSDNESSKTVTFYAPVELGDEAQVFCESQDVVLSVPEGYTYYEWSTGGNIDDWIMLGNENSIVTSAPGEYVITTIDLNNCLSRDSVNIHFEDLAPSAIALNGTTICSGKAISLKGSSTTAGITYQWLKNSQVIAGASSDTWLADQPGTYEVKVSSADCSEVSQPLQIVAGEAPVKPQITIHGNVDLCPTETVKLLVAPAQSTAYQWVKDGGIIPGKTAAEVDINTKGNYKVLAMSMGCTTESDVVAVQQLDRPVRPSVTGPSELCVGNEITISAPSGFTGYLWSTGETTQQIQIRSGGSYSVIVTATCSSLPSESKTVIVKPLPVAVLEFDLSTFTVSKGDSYRWYLNDQLIAGASTQSYSPQKDGTYKAEVQVGNCSAMSNAVTVIITDVEAALEKQIALYPNPVQRYLNVQIPSNLSNSFTVRLTNALGMLNSNLNMTRSDHGFVIDLNGFSSGLYWLEIESASGRLVRKVMIE